jgi:hypothetical protein
MVFESVEISTPAEESPAVSWPAIAAGAIAAAALTLVLLAFGAGMGFSAVSPWGNSGISASTFQISTALYLMVVALLASALGGYVAGRLRTRWVGVHTHEVFFRDTAHGFLAWALATVIGAGFLAAAASNIAGGASPGLAPAANVSATTGSGSSLDYYVDALLRPNPAASPNTTDLGPARREIAGILTKGIGDGDVAGPDRTYMAQVAAARTGLSQADADKRVSNVIDPAALLVGAFAASLTATRGGKVRDFNASLTDG